MDINDNTDDVEPMRAVIVRKDHHNGGSNRDSITSKNIVAANPSPGGYSSSIKSGKVPQVVGKKSSIGSNG